MPTPTDAPGRTPEVSILVPVFDTPEPFLRAMVASVRAQTFADWELVLVDDGSSAPHVGPVLAELAAADERIVVDRLAANAGIVAASARALDLASGRWVALVDHDDELAPEALARCMEVISADPLVDMVYTDENRRGPGGDIPMRKPDWSPERLRAQMYTGHLTALRRSLVSEVGGFRPGFDGSQDYDLVLRAGERARRVAHIPEVLYHWRLVPGSVGQVGRPEVFAAARQAVADHLARTGAPGTVEQVDPTGVYRIRRPVLGHPLVSLVIPTRGSSGTVGGRERVYVVELLRGLVARCSWARWEAVVVADTATPPATVDALRAVAGDRLTLVPFDEPFHFARKINRGALAAAGDYLVALNDDMDLVTPDWLETMLGLAQQPDVGMVGPLLTFEDGTIQHGGLMFRRRTPDNIGHGMGGDERGPMFGFGVEREVSGCTGACALLPTGVFHEVGGMSERFAVNYNDVDLSFKVRASGRRILWTPFAHLRHFESKSRTGGVGASEVAAILGRWGRRYEGEDPYWPAAPAGPD
ncbi:glycosyltransferase [Acidiferrimicrobium sp. IK]|uniref:glycosyltransferase family 2 protein n=1 Tax=Acidiferrimicrobium sp. IK TaxID=2871700 RepID=UPI0021CAEBB3|nr:glycosyltransferase [Acidiferrimicrobium sp. IK]MCU4185559.1 glycosyltransferase [Acidiferrimicrobium sp. IK]